MKIDGNRRRLLTALGSLALLPMIPPTGFAGVPPLTGRTMGTRYRLQLVTVPEGVSMQLIQSRVASILQDTESAMSLYRPDSVLCQLNRSQGNKAFSLSPQILEVIEAALQIKTASEAAFDPLSESLVRQWGFGPQNQWGGEHALFASPTVPLSSGNIHIKGKQLFKSHDAVSLDLNGIAKGHAIDRISNMLKSYSIDDFLIEIGGEVLSAGNAAEGRPWRIGIEHPAGGIDTVATMTDKALATSGDYIDFYMLGNQRISHLVDPRSGRPIAHGLAAVSVVADSAMVADAWATALMVLGPREGDAIARSNGIAARFIERHDNGYQTTLTPGFRRFIGS